MRRIYFHLLILGGDNQVFWTIRNRRCFVEDQNLSGQIQKSEKGTLAQNVFGIRWPSTSLWNAISDVNRLARPSKVSPFSRQSIPCRWTFTARPARMTEMVSPSETPTTFPVKVSLATLVLNQPVWKSGA